jgi:hypothetical protein
MKKEFFEFCARCLEGISRFLKPKKKKKPETIYRDLGKYRNE